MAAHSVSLSHSLELLKASAHYDFIQHLSMAVDRVAAPESSIPPESLVVALGDILPHNHALPVQLLDVINQCWWDHTPDSRRPLIALLRSLIKSNIVTVDLTIELVDRNILQDSAIISNSQILATRSVRINTGLLYKQQKFNLLREENEGYAKLSHEFNVALSELPKSGFIDASDISAKSDDLLTVVNALIGYFELDPNRVLDNILDICSQNLLSHARFILYFLHHSPWAPHTLAVGSPFASVDKTEKRRRLDSIQIDFIGYFKGEMLREGGSKLAAQLLGFKLRFFASTLDTGERSHTSPESVIFLIALLIKSGFVKLSDIYPYVSTP
jgi:THO complex subunit 2